MSFKVLTVLAVLFVIHGTQGLPAFPGIHAPGFPGFPALSGIIGKELSPETWKKLEEAIIQTTLAKKKSSVRLDEIRDEIEKRIDNALKPVDKELDDLKEEVKQAKKDAKKSKIDISDCVKTEKKSVHHLDTDEIKKCRDTEETRKAGLKVGEIGRLIRVLHNAPKLCAKEGADADACVEKLIEDAQQQTKDLQEEIANLLKNVDTSKQDKCISKAAESLQKQVDGIAAAWNECLESHKTTTPATTTA